MTLNLKECPKFHGFVRLWVSCYRAFMGPNFFLVGISWIQNFFSWVVRRSSDFLSWVFREAKINLMGILLIQNFSHGYLVGPNFFLDFIQVTTPASIRRFCLLVLKKFPNKDKTD